MMMSTPALFLLVLRLVGMGVVFGAVVVAGLRLLLNYDGSSGAAGAAVIARRYLQDFL